MARAKDGMEGGFKGKSPIRKGLRFRFGMTRHEREASRKRSRLTRYRLNELLLSFGQEIPQSLDSGLSLILRQKPELIQGFKTLLLFVEIASLQSIPLMIVSAVGYSHRISET
ncbi:hypothetical protein UM91_01530 [Pseudomonas oryzihabitans]|nr:hypothetical protein UM91_01530 [Pseudomonas oryzihabitans]